MRRVVALSPAGGAPLLLCYLLACGRSGTGHLDAGHRTLREQANVGSQCATSFRPLSFLVLRFISHLLHNARRRRRSIAPHLYTVRQRRSTRFVCCLCDFLVGMDNKHDTATHTHTRRAYLPDVAACPPGRQSSSNHWARIWTTQRPASRRVLCCRQIRLAVARGPSALLVQQHQRASAANCLVSPAHEHRLPVRSASSTPARQRLNPQRSGSAQPQG